MRAGTYQVCSDRLERHDSHIRRQVGHRNMAGDLVLGVSNSEAREKGGCHDSGREDVSSVAVSQLSAARSAAYDFESALFANIPANVGFPEITRTGSPATRIN